MDQILDEFQPWSLERQNINCPFDWMLSISYTIKQGKKIKYSLEHDVAHNIVIFNEHMLRDTDHPGCINYTQELIFDSKDEAKQVYDKLIDKTIEVGHPEINVQNVHTLKRNKIYLRIMDNNPEVFEVEEVSKKLYETLNNIKKMKGISNNIYKRMLLKWYKEQEKRMKMNHLI